MVILPYQVDAPMQRWPIGNWLVLVAILVCFLTLDIVHYESPSVSLDDMEETERAIWLFTRRPILSPMVLQDWSLDGLLGHMWLHNGLFHLIGNMFFLWTFGNAVCAKVGNVVYPFLFAALGVCGGVVHLLLDGSPAVGASGAINGIIGAYLVLYPVNEVSCMYFILFYLWGFFRMHGFWLILLWAAFDVLGAALGFGGVAYWAHIGGFVTGFGTTSALVLTGVIRMSPSEQSLYQAFGLMENVTPPLRRTERDTAFGADGTEAGTAPAEGGRHVECRCGHVVHVPDDYPSQNVPCPACGRALCVPWADGEAP